MRKIEELAADVEKAVTGALRSTAGEHTRPVLELELAFEMFVVQLETNRLLGKLVDGIRPGQESGLTETSLKKVPPVESKTYAGGKGGK
jgi:hypothetical protein